MSESGTVDEKETVDIINGLVEKLTRIKSVW